MEGVEANVEMTLHGGVSSEISTQSDVFSQICNNARNILETFLIYLRCCRGA